MNALYVLALVIVTIIIVIVVSLETEEGSEPHCHTQDSGWGHLSAKSHVKLGIGKGGKSDPKLHTRTG